MKRPFGIRTNSLVQRITLFRNLITIAGVGPTRRYYPRRSRTYSELDGGSFATEIPSEWQVYKVKFTAKEGDPLAHLFESTSLLRRAYDQDFLKGIISTRDQWLSCRYWLRPGITGKGSRTENVGGVLYLRDSGTDFDVVFLYDERDTGYQTS